MSIDVPSPGDLGAPPPFSEWRDSQAEAFYDAITSDRRFVALAVPTGVGKSLIAVGLHLLTRDPALYLTATKGLQDQIHHDFHRIGLRDVRGMSNYPCREREGIVQCDRGPCLEGFRCMYVGGGCEYFDAVAAGVESQLTSTNYAFHFTHDKGLGTKSLLVCDEAHSIPEELSSFLRVELHEAEINLPRADMDIAGWSGWAQTVGKILAARLEATPAGYGKKQLKGLIGRVDRLATASGDWVVERVERGMAFEPVWPGPYAEQHLWRGASKVLLLSATLRPQTLQYLGIAPDDYEFHEYPSPFPKEDRRITYVPTVRLTHRVTHDEMLTWVNRIDQIIEGRLDRKGIVHTTSYARAKFLVENSRWSDLLLMHTTRTTRDVVRQFKDAEAPAVLVSPSVTTGWDFPMTDCEYQIIGKIPFPDTRPAVMRARVEQDPNYAGFVAATDIVQATGRGIRGPGDRCETFIVDDAAAWFIYRFRDAFPRWWREAYGKESVIPDPPEKIA